MTALRLKLIVIRSMDVFRCAAFYRQFGIEFSEHRHGTGPLHFAAELAGVVFEIYLTRKVEDVDRTTRLGFVIPDIHTSIPTLHSNGVEFVEELEQTEWGQRVVVRDPDGRSVELYAAETSP
ncbi:VOC family protein [Schlesneria sp. DSM 10557]|uniref:VOC family protein n=1 Tax=Schlesneria sp. DSM 10557 TaxID=3044399 RepID=UPI0035A10793